MSSPDSPSPSREQLQGSLSGLQEELARTSSMDSESRQRLQTLLADVHRVLHGSSRAATAPIEQAIGERATDPVAAPSQRLESLAVLFEVEHPVLAGSLRQFIELCNRAGL